MASERKLSKKTTKPRKPEQKPPGKRHAGGDKASAAGLATLQQQVGNRAVQRLVAQRRDEGVAQTGGKLGEGQPASMEITNRRASPIGGIE